MKYMNQAGRPVIKKTRGTQQGSNRQGPRGQAQSFVNIPIKDNTGFRRFDGSMPSAMSTPCGCKGKPSNSMSMSVPQYVMGLLSVGVLFYVIGFGYGKGKAAA